ncbi:DEAD/DEAH box helicase [Streptomyces sp. ICC1]|uniref:DEAD/DEAH box helicase n=1 Tax=Streptomyces sp. ICC1 TaxID=2099583 RepID=UPI000DC7822D|nr:DEAD/DEAH box helicase [Streptomyces sp. ICC1]AWZ16126.1 helicase [Streptomyces sp. ICC1]
MPTTNRVDQREAAQREAIDAVLHALEPPTGSPVPERGLRTQVIMATGSGKTRVAIHSAQELHADRVLVLVPSLDLLAQTEAAWRDGGRQSPAIGVSSLRGEEAPFPNTTDADELVEWTRGLNEVTVYATYASLGLGTLEKAHSAGLPAWDLIVVDEAHRTSGRIGKPWAVIHDNTRIPALRRLYMTATPRLWQLGNNGARVPGELVASMDDTPHGTFGSRCYTLTLSEAIDRGICAPYQVVCVDITDPQLQAAQLLGTEARSEEVRGARIAALQTSLVKASSVEDFRRTLVFHHVVKEAEAFAVGLPDVTAQLNNVDPELYPATIWADWLCGEHRPLHRRRVLAEFADSIATDGTTVEKAYLSSVKVLGEGVDTRTCDSVYWADVRGSMPDLVQAVGRALRMQPDEGKVASLVVPVLLGPGETPDNMLTSRAYGGLAKLLAALRAHDARIVETLAEPQAPSRYKPSTTNSAMNSNGSRDGSRDVSAPAKALLKFSTPRDPAALSAFINLRVLNPEHEHWRRGIEAAVIYARTQGDLRVPSTFRVPAVEATATSRWPATLAAFPLGQWIADARRLYNRGGMSQERARQLEKLGMIWSHYDVNWEEGLSAAHGWAAEHGHLLAPVDATYQGAAVGIWLKNARAAARKATEIEQRRTQGLPVHSSAWTMTQERREQLEAIDPAWCPVWPVAWQRCFHLVRRHLGTGQDLPTAAGETMCQGEDLGRWVTSVRHGWDQLTSVQQWMCQHVLGIAPAGEDEKPKPRTSQADKWELHYDAATQFFAREGHLTVPRKHIETITIGGDSQDQAQRDVELRLGAWIANQRTRASTLTPQRTEQLSKVGMRWA